LALASGLVFTPTHAVINSIDRHKPGTLLHWVDNKRNSKTCIACMS